MADTGNPNAGRAHGSVWLGPLVSRIARPGLQRVGSGLGALAAEWPAIVGPELALVTRPHRLSGTAPQTLTIACDGKVAMELRHLEPQLIERINHFASTRVGGIGYRNEPAKPRPAPAAPKARRGATAEFACSDIKDPELRATMVALYRAISD
jgi:hypothetical protein